MTAECNICGGAEFIPGPNNRLSRSRLRPLCKKCRSLERHRIGRRVVTAIRVRERFLKLDLLQLSNDNVVTHCWFANVEISVYGGANSIDIQRIDWADGRYRFIVCSNILVHVSEPRRAIRELGRVFNTNGLLFLAYHNPRMRAVTVDWGFPEPAQHVHYWIFGGDFEGEYHTLLPDAYTAAVQEEDAVTGDDDNLYLISNDVFRINRILASPFACRLISQAGSA